MTDQKTLAYINLFGVLGSITELCRQVPEAQALIADKKITISFVVKNGPSGRLAFEGGHCTVIPGDGPCQVRLPFSSCEKFNGLIDGTVTPIPSKGFTKIGFLLGAFTKLTDLLSKYLRATEEDLRDPEFFRVATLMKFYVVSEAISQIGNHDKIGQASASYIVDGVVKMAIGDVVGAAIAAKDHILTTTHEMPADFFAYMTFKDMELAAALFDGKVNSVASVGHGDITIAGMISMIENMNRILDRVALYLA
jgi:hypothetical protein